MQIDDTPTSSDDDNVDDSSIELPIDGELDLHTFHPRDIKTLVPDYLEACLERGITEARIVHGKGTGALRETVHATLRRLPYVAEFRLGDHTSGGWGATVVALQPPDTTVKLIP